MLLSIDRGLPWLSECPSYSRQPVGSRKKARRCKRTADPISSGTAATHNPLSVLPWSHSVLEHAAADSTSQPVDANARRVLSWYADYSAKRALPVRGKDRSPPDHHNPVRRTCFLPVNADLGRRKGSSPCR